MIQVAGSRDALSYLKLARKLSALAVLGSFAYIGVGLLSLPLRWYQVHMHFMGMGVVSFAAGVNISFWTSVTRRRGSVLAALLHSLSLLFLPLGSLLGWGTVMITFVSLTGLLFLIPLRKRSLIYLLELYSFLSLLSAALSSYRGMEVWLTTVEWAYPVPLIYAVTLHALPKTYRYRASLPLTILMTALHALALSGFGPSRHLMWASMLSYLGAARLDLSLRGLRSVRVREALPAHRYLIAGYLLLIPLLILSWFMPVNSLGLLHILLLGFVGLHIYAHAPMMIPVLLGIRNAKRFNYSALLLLLLAALSWPFNRDVALYFLLGSLFLVVYIVKP
ncbi:MAG: hypothetical protein QI199_02555 [Candidatus Korarchaeota archaeon]|nr:hypothetical protein [Candidatus Korarchaeota archaeon]